MTNTEFVYPFLRCKTEDSSKCDYLYKEGLKVTSYTDAYGLPYKSITMGESILVDAGGLYCNGKMVNNSALSDGWVVGYDFNQADAFAESQTAIFIGFISDCWGHTITDSMSKLWWLQTEEYRTLYSDCPIYYWAPKPLLGNFLELLCLVGVPMDRLHSMDHLTYFHNVLVPDNCYKRMDDEITPLVYSSEYVKLIDAIVSKCCNNMAYNKVCMIRPSDSRQYTSEKIFSILKHKGFVFIDSSHCSVAEQISIFQNAKEIVVEESSASHNAIFCKRNTKLIILRKCSYINAYQASINHMRNLDVIYIDCHYSVLTRPQLLTEGPFFLYANQEFCRYFGVKYSGFPYAEFRKWLNYHNYYIENTDIRAKRLQWDIHYAEIFAEELDYTRKETEQTWEFVKHLPIIPKSIRERGFLWIVKKHMRRLM